MKHLLTLTTLLTVCLLSSAQRYVNKKNIDSLYNHQRLANVTILDSNEKVVTLSTIIDSIRNGHCYLMPKHLRDTSTLYLAGDQSRFNWSFFNNYLKEQDAENAQKVGTKHPDFTVTDLSGNTYHLAEMKGKVVVLNYWFTTCGPCREEIPYLNEIVDSYKDRNDILFISFGRNSKEQLTEFLKTTMLGYHVVPISIKETQVSNIFAFPTNMVINREGVITYFQQGSDKEGYLVRKLKRRIAKDLRN